MKFLALFFNAESTANALFSTNQAGVLSVTSASANLTAGVSGARPLMAFVRHTEANALYGQAEDWQISFAPYKLEFVTLAGGRNMARPAAAGVPPGAKFVGDDLAFSSVAAWKAAVAGVDVVIDETYAPDARTFSYGTFFTLFNFTAADVTAGGRWPFLANGRVFREDRTINDGTYSRGITGMDWRALSRARELAQSHDRAVAPAAAQRLVCDIPPSILAAASAWSSTVRSSHSAPSPVSSLRS